WMGLVVPEQYGGAGVGVLELALLCEQLGRCVVPGPFFSSAVLATLAILHGGSSAQKKRWLPPLARGELIGTLALLQESDGLAGAGITRGRRRGGGKGALAGGKPFVTEAHVADLLVVACRSAGRDEEGITLFLVPRETPGVKVLPLPSVDVTRRPMEVRF